MTPTEYLMQHFRVGIDACRMQGEYRVLCYVPDEELPDLQISIAKGKDFKETMLRAFDEYLDTQGLSGE